VAIRARIIRIGNSRGIRLPKQVLDQTGLEDEVELEIQGRSIVVHPAYRARSGWDEQCRIMAEQGDDRLLDADAPPLTTWDETEWEW
jgi:antitoxin MazE